MLSRYKSIEKNKSYIIEKTILAGILCLLLWSKLLSSYDTIQQAHASFNTNIKRGEFTISQNPNQAQKAIHHLNIQAEVTKKPKKRLKKLAEQERKAQRIRNFYARWDAPMAEQALYIVEVSEHFGIDFRLLPAISVVESSGGNYCFKSYNPFGWGKTGFKSFEEAIYTVAKGIAHGYRTDDPHIIGPTYNPVTPDQWSAKVDNLMEQI
jgi:hypothetical protein